MLDCRYELHLSSTLEKANILYEVKKFLREFEGDEEVQAEVEE